MLDQPIELVELADKPRTGLRVTVGQVKAGEQHGIDRRLDTAARLVIGIAGKRLADQNRIGLQRKQRDDMDQMTWSIATGRCARFASLTVSRR